MSLNDLKICVDFVRATEGRVNFRVAGLRDEIIDKLILAHLESFVASFELRNHKLTLVLEVWSKPAAKK